MNAKEFAHELEKAASFIRQQQNEIEKLKNLVEVQDEKIIDLAFRAVYAERGAEVVAELYTHPAKELTDEEIEVKPPARIAAGLTPNMFP